MAMTSLQTLLVVVTCRGVDRNQCSGGTLRSGCSGVVGGRKQMPLLITRDTTSEVSEKLR